MRYKVTLAYDGTNFCGFQRQPNQRTVEGELTRVVNKIAKRPFQKIFIYGSGRTDAGVHALEQVVHFDFPFYIQTENMLKSLNSMIPVDMRVLSVTEVSNQFHARYDVSGKRYVYRMDLGYYHDPFKRNYTGHWRFPVNIEKIRMALKDLIGEHDFTSFVASGSNARNNYRKIYEATAKIDKQRNELVFEFYGNGFLYNQVRIMVGVLIEIGSGTRQVDSIQELYRINDRRYAHRTVSASGLYLKHVYYNVG